MKHLGQFLWIAAFAGVCGIAGASAAHALATPLWPGLLAGLVLGTLPAWLPRLVHGLEAARCAEWVGLAALIVIAGTLSLTALLPALQGDDVRLETTLPLVLIAPALYLMYLILNRSDLAVREESVADRLAGALSGPPLLLSLAMGVTLATCAVLLIRYAGLSVPSWEFVTARFTDRGIIPPLTLALFFWGLLLLANKTWVLWRERRMLGGAPGRSVLMRAREDALVTDPGDTDDFLEMVWRKSADFYIVPRYINWAIPILGFIGTVLGISLAANGIQSVIGSGRSLVDLSSELGQAIAPLGIAFDTTLIALSLSVFLTLLQVALQRWEDNVLVDYESWVRSTAVRRR